MLQWRYGKKEPWRPTIEPGRRHGDSQHPLRGEAVLIVGAGPEGVKTMAKETVRLGPIRVPGEVVAAKIEYAWQISEERPASLVKCENVGGPLHKLVFRKTILRGGMVLGPFIDEVWGRSTVEVATVIVDGDYIEVAQVRDGGAPIVAWLADLVHDLWLDDAPAAQDDQAPAGSTSGGGATKTGETTHGIKAHADAIRRLDEEGQSRTANYAQWYREYEAETGIDPETRVSGAAELYRGSVWKQRRKK